MSAVVKAKKIPNLPAANSVAAADLFVIEKVGASSNVTSYIAGTDLRKSICFGPYADDAAANSAGIAIREMYYTAAGVVKVRLT